MCHKIPKRQCTVDTWLERRPGNVRSCRRPRGTRGHAAGGLWWSQNRRSADRALLIVV
jgi:hypothetical protein